jgi:natural product precursor
MVKQGSELQDTDLDVISGGSCCGFTCEPETKCGQICETD